MLEDRKKEGLAGMALAPRERRAHPRYPFTAGAELIDVRSGTRLNARISDIGRGGCYVDSISPFTVGTEVKIRITKDANSFSSQAKVVYASMGMGMGLMFTVIEPEQRWMLEKWLAELRGEPSPEGESAEQPKDRRIEEQSETAKPTQAEQSYVLNELIIALMRKRVLTDAEGKALLQKLLS
jgi:PilZ domain-containing protein